MARGQPTGLQFEQATANDAPQLAELHSATAAELTRVHGKGPWSGVTSEKGVLWAMRRSRVYLGRQNNQIVATLQLTTRKPWAIDTSYFSPCARPLYLLGMAVRPADQRQGIGRWCMQQAMRTAKAWPADAIRLDAYDAAAGAGGFYSSCGCKEVGRVVFRGVPLIYFEIPVE